MFPLIAILLLAALVICIMSGIGKAPLWVSVLLLIIVVGLVAVPHGFRLN